MTSIDCCDMRCVGLPSRLLETPATTTSDSSACGLLIVTPLRADASERTKLVRASASKTYEFSSGAGWRKLSDYDHHHRIGIVAYEASNVDDLAEVVRVAGACNAYIVRGALTSVAIAAQHRDGDGPMGALLNRRKVAKQPGDEPSLREADRCWAMLDVDGWPLPEHLSLHNARDHVAIIDAMIREVAHASFHGVRCFYQFSASCGLTDPAIAKAHLWFWLDQPASNDRLRSLCIHEMPGVDYTPFSAVQPHYVAPPKLIGGHDPLPSRYGWREAADEAVVLPIFPAREANVLGSSSVAAACGSDWTGPLRIMGDGEGRLRCQIASKSDPHFAPNRDPSSGGIGR